MKRHFAGRPSRQSKRGSR